MVRNQTYSEGRSLEVLEMFTDSMLVEEVRAGEKDPALVLWRRHSTDCRNAIASVVDEPSATDRILRSAFARVIQEITCGTDPLSPFPLYLRTTALLDACLDGVDKSSVTPIVRAFGDLGRLDQAILWASTINNATLSEIAQTASVSVDLAAERLHAAESRLRARWVEEILRGPLETPTCSWVAQRVALLRAGLLGPQATARYDRHLSGCASCRQFVEDDAGLPFALINALLFSPRH